ncbi:MAG: S49 family peptidase [Alphaproteobacteria bacterium]|nr:S49 family peptidase [Alphaproteobacteria bacterium]
MPFAASLTRARAALFGPSPPLVAVLRLAGAIGRVLPVSRGLALGALAPAIERAFTLDGVRAVALEINSPGGSPVQSALIHQRIRALADEHDVPVHAFIEDVGASGGYWLACAADEIHADASSIVGSIGVISQGFGFEGLIRHLGIERRLHASGASKGMLDPFRPEEPAHVAHLGRIQADIHATFKAMVRARRGAKLRASEDELFSGAFWTGGQALALGLVDGLGDMQSVLRRRFGEKTRFRRVGPRPPLLRRFWRPGETGIGDVATGLVAAIEERALWARYGL